MNLTKDQMETLKALARGDCELSNDIAPPDGQVTAGPAIGLSQHGLALRVPGTKMMRITPIGRAMLEQLGDAPKRPRGRAAHA